MDASVAGARRSQKDRRATSDRRMLRAAIALIARHGSMNVSMAQIGLAAGYSRGLPAERFGTKLKLLEAVVDATEIWFDRRLQSQLGARTGFAALATRITVHMESVSESSEAAIALYQLVVEATGSVPDLKDRITRLNRSYAEGMRLHLLEAQDDGSLRPGVDIERHALAIVSAMHGLAIQALIRGDTPSLCADSRYIAEIHVAAVARRPFPPGRGEAPYD